MENLKTLISSFDCEYVQDYKKIWIKAKLNSKDDLLIVAKALKKDGLRSLSTVSPTDFLADNIMELNYFFEDLHTKRNLWLKVDLPRDEENCEIESITPIFPSANWHEREAFSMFGVNFLHHPDLREIIKS